MNEQAHAVGTPGSSVQAPLPRQRSVGSHLSDLERLRAGSPMYDAAIEEIDGRRIRVGDHWLADFASCNYLGFDLDREIIDASTALCAPGALTPAGPGCSATRCPTPRSRSVSPPCSAPRTPWFCRRSRTSTCR